MSQKLIDTDKLKPAAKVAETAAQIAEDEGLKYARNVNVSFSVKGEDVYSFAMDVASWLKEQEETWDNLRISHFRYDYFSEEIKKETKK